MLTPAFLTQDPDLKTALVSRLTDIENGLMVAEGEWGGGGKIGRAHV